MNFDVNDKIRLLQGQINQLKILIGDGGGGDVPVDILDRLAKLESDIADLTLDYHNLSGDVANNEAGISEINTKITTLSGDVANLNSNLESTNQIANEAYAYAEQANSAAGEALSSAENAFNVAQAAQKQLYKHTTTFNLTFTPTTTPKVFTFIIQSISGLSTSYTDENFSTYVDVKGMPLISFTVSNGLRYMCFYVARNYQYEFIEVDGIMAQIVGVDYEFKIQDLSMPGNTTKLSFGTDTVEPVKNV